jgi:hypothetical protein
MGMSDIEIGRIYRAYVAGKIRASRRNCPPIKDVREAFEGKTRRAAKDRIVDHVSDCAYCAQEFEFIRAVRARERELDEGIRGIARLRRPALMFLSRPLWNYAIGIAMIAIVLSGILLFRGNGPRDEWRNGSVAIPEARGPSGHIDTPSRLIFRWKPVAGATSYIVEIDDESLRLIWESPPVMTSAALLPEPLKESFSGDKKYYWSVTALDSEGRIGESRFEVFSVDR